MSLLRTERICRGKCEKRQKKRLSSQKTGDPSPDVLTTTYKSYVRPVLNYGGELLATASKNSGDNINKIQNKAFNHSASSTPITANEIQTNIEPLGG
ncbi:hypothetical protein TNCT_549811 [Trichonephila clavata]|uniref:Uncharacterized protein n=1 Tax=Trichonephila clavata TaxID=2740835 RepID=A0A8X6HPY4_TRICU|nr:hypothetical protein TNCT_549811 [Trichonephila clavata]